MDYNWGADDDMKEKYTAKVSALFVCVGVCVVCECVSVAIKGRCGHTHTTSHKIICRRILAQSHSESLDEISRRKANCHFIFLFESAMTVHMAECWSYRLRLTVFQKVFTRSDISQIW